MTRFQFLRRFVRARYNVSGWICMNIRQPIRSATWPLRDFHAWRYFRASVKAVQQGKWVIRA